MGAALGSSWHKPSLFNDWNSKKCLQNKLSFYMGLAFKTSQTFWKTLIENEYKLINNL